MAGSTLGNWDHIVIGAGSAGCVVANQLLRAGRRDDAAARLRALAATNASGAQVARLRAMLQNAP